MFKSKGINKTGIHAFLGTSWVVVDAPGKEGTAIHVAVGVGVVWVVTKDYKVTRNMTNFKTFAKPNACKCRSVPIHVAMCWCVLCRCGSGEV